MLGIRILIIILLIVIFCVYIKYPTIKYKYLMYVNTNKIKLYEISIKIYNVNSKILKYISSEIFNELLLYIKIPFKYIETLKILIKYINNQIEKYYKKK